MKIYHVTAIEKFLVRTHYRVEANSKREAVRLCQAGEVAYASHECLEGKEEWIETESVVEDTHARG